MQLSPTSLLSLKQSQICSAVGLLEFYCQKNFWSLPEYHLYSTQGQDGNLLLLYKVSTRTKTPLTWFYQKPNGIYSTVCVCVCV